MWEQLCRAMDRADLLEDPRFKGWIVRHANGAACYEEIAKWTRQRTKHEAMRILGSAGVPCSAVLDTKDLFADAHLAARGFIRPVEHAALGSVPHLASPLRLGASDVPLVAAPLLGGHTAQVLRADLGLSEDEIARLRQQGVVAGPELE
jgi:formyl-CoA transferase